LAEEVNAQLAEVQIPGDETLEGALRRFKRKVLQEDIIKEIRRHSLLSEAWRKKTHQRSAGAQAESKKKK
jgi:small subunit ribosomal protein S21